MPVFEVARDDMVRLLSECKQLGRETIASVRVENDTLHVSSSKETIVYFGSVPCTGKPLSCSVAPGPLAGLLASCSGDFAKVSLAKHTLSVDCGNATAAFPTMGDYGDHGAQIRAGSSPVTLADPMIFEGLYCMSKNENRPNLCAVSVGDGKAATTDGHRMCVVKVECQSKVLIPGYLAAKAARLIRDDEVTVSNTETMAVLQGRHQAWAQALPQGDFPDTEGLIKGNQPNPNSFINVDADALSRAVGTAILVSEAGKVGLTATVEGVLTVAAAEATLGNTAVEIECSGGTTLSCFCSGLYLQQAIKGAKVVAIAQKDELSPLFVRTDDKLDVIMPMRG